MVAAGLPLAVTTAGFIGVLEAHRRFRLINLIRVPTGIYVFLGPLCVLPFSQSLLVVVTVLMIGRVVECLVYFVLCLREIPSLRAHPTFRRALVRPLFGFGGWTTVSDIAMPLLVHVDRFLIGAVLSVSAVTYYVTPAEIVVKLLIFPRAWMSVLFPTFAAQQAADPRGTADLYARGVKYLLIFSFPVALAASAFAGEGLRIWLGVEFADRSTAVMRWLTAGIFVSSLSYVPFSLLQAGGRPDLSARLHLVEVALYGFLSVFLIRRLGIEGAAIAWFLRSIVDALCMFVLARRFAPGAGQAVVRSGLIAGVALCLIAGTVSLPSFPARLLAWAVGAVGFLSLCWTGLLNAQERDFLRRLLRRAEA